MEEQGTKPHKKMVTFNLVGFQYQELIVNSCRLTCFEILLRCRYFKFKLATSKIQGKKFSKVPACFLNSTLTKSYDYWGINVNYDGKRGVNDKETEDYDRIANNPEIEKVVTMKIKKLLND